jgi:hypothetical protein
MQLIKLNVCLLFARRIIVLLSACASYLEVYAELLDQPREGWCPERDDVRLLSPKDSVGYSRAASVDVSCGPIVQLGQFTEQFKLSVF